MGEQQGYNYNDGQNNAGRNRAEDETYYEAEQTELLALTCIILFLIIVTIIFDKTKEFIIDRTTKGMKPLIDALFGEMTTLGFVSVVAFILGQTGVFTVISTAVFGENDVLEELFELAHFALFFVMIFFVLEVFLMVYEGLQIERQWKQMEQLSRHPTVYLRPIVAKLESYKERLLFGSDEAVPDQSVIIARKLLGFCGQSSLEYEKDAIFYYMLRQEFLMERSSEYPFEPLPDEQRLSDEFSFARYLSICLGKTLADIVTIRDETWSLYAAATIAFGALVQLLQSTQDYWITLSWMWLGVEWVVFFCNVSFENHLLNIRRSFVADKLPKELMPYYRPVVPQDECEDVSQYIPVVEKFKDDAHEHDRLPIWCQEKMKAIVNREKERSISMRHCLLSWFSFNESYFIILLQTTFLFSGVNAGILALAFIPAIYNSSPTWLFSVYLICVLIPSTLIFFQKKHLIATMTQVCSLGAHRKPQVIAAVHREAKTESVVRTFLVISRLRRFASEVSRRTDILSKEQVALTMLKAGVLTDFERHEVSKVFRNIDRDGNGEIDLDEFRELFSGLGAEMLDDKLQMLFEFLDQDGGGTVSESEFIQWYASYMGGGDMSVETCTHDLFHYFHTINSGEISLAEFNRKMTALNVGFTLDEVGDLVNELDKDGNGTVGLEEFHLLVKRYFPRELLSLSERSSEHSSEHNDLSSTAFHELS